MPTAHLRHSIAETPAPAAALESLPARPGTEIPTLVELVMRGAQANLRELATQDRANAQGRSTFVSRLSDGPQPDLDGGRPHAPRRPAPVSTDLAVTVAPLAPLGSLP